MAQIVPWDMQYMLVNSFFNMKISREAEDMSAVISENLNVTITCTAANSLEGEPYKSSTNWALQIISKRSLLQT